MARRLELRKAGLPGAQILEYNDRAGGRNWSIRGGDSYTELGGATQHCGFAKGHYLNPGPWRIPYHHRACCTTASAFGVALEPFIQVNYNAFVHSTTRSAASRSATATCRPTSRGSRRAARQGDRRRARSIDG